MKNRGDPNRLSEQALESNNKCIRLYIEKLSRKISEFCTMQDVLDRLWLKSDNIIRSFEKQTKCSRCGKFDHHTRGCPDKHSILSDKKLSLQDYFV